MLKLKTAPLLLVSHRIVRTHRGRRMHHNNNLEHIL